ncbi:DUF6199 family natural product biosynthesis protein [Mycolicibacterium peregrinum]|uniref:DUF6199 family natural product biosynthesis protein n=1 Tax=Mycolicibacterium peregrinum TaxID=43304 RepID=UPI003012DB37
MGIFLIVVGVLVGGVMAAAPRGIWWATQSWKFRNPEANEPSDTAYGMTRVGGVSGRQTPAGGRCAAAGSRSGPGRRCTSCRS